jgi:peroxiredoxin
VAQVVSHQTQIEAAKANVVTVSFGSPYWARVWLHETQSPFPFVSDPERQAYRAYNLASSAWRSWSPATLWYYAKAKMQGRKTGGNRGDAHQLGGDFVIDAHGIIRLAHPSREPTDRPSAAKVLSLLDRLHTVAADV